MKTTKLYIVLFGLLALSATQAAAVEYKGTYRGVQVQPAFGIATTATAPSAGFQSTSAYSEQWVNEEPQSILNTDGTINSNAYGIGRKPGLRKDPGSGPGAGGPGNGNGSSPGTPGGTLDPTTQQPLGDALLPLLLMALAYILCMRFTKKSSEQ